MGLIVLFLYFATILYGNVSYLSPQMRVVICYFPRYVTCHDVLVIGLIPQIHLIQQTVLEDHHTPSSNFDGAIRVSTILRTHIQIQLWIVILMYLQLFVLSIYHLYWYLRPAEPPCSHIHSFRVLNHATICRTCSSRVVWDDNNLGRFTRWDSRIYREEELICNMIRNRRKLI